MRKIYRESFGYFLSSFPALLALGATLEVLLWVLQPKSETGVSFIALTIVAYYFHRHFLFGETFSFFHNKPIVGAPPMKFGWFILVSAGLVFVPVAIALIVVFGFINQHSPGVLILTLMPVYLVALSLFGTALPATVVRDGSYQLSQGLRSAFQTLWRLVLGPGVVGLVLLAATILAGNALDLAGVNDGSLLVLAYYILVRTLGFLTTIFAVAVLCDMYRRTRPAPHQGQGVEMSGHTPA